MGAVGSCVSFVLFFFSCVYVSAPLWASDIVGPLYIGGVYKPAAPLIGDANLGDAFGGKIEVSPLSRGDCNDLLGNCRDAKPVFDKSPRLASSGDYGNSVVGSAFIVGCGVGSSRVELEFQSEKFDVRRGVFVLERGDKFRYSLAQRVGLRPHVGSATRKATLREGGVISIRNSGVGLVSGIISVCRDIEVGFGTMPYVCGGFGLERAKSFGATSFGVACQVRGGVSYRMNNRLSGFAGFFYRRFGMGGDSEFSVPLSSSNISIGREKLTGDEGMSEEPRKTELVGYGLFIDPVVRMGIAYYGVEMGVRFSFGG
ncbi:MAG: P44/Msp2 family outer membrane protein [Aaplasma endosymbiont of Hyalomma asiaticum]